MNRSAVIVLSLIVIAPAIGSAGEAPLRPRGVVYEKPDALDGILDLAATPGLVDKALKGPLANVRDLLFVVYGDYMDSHYYNPLDGPRKGLSPQPVDACMWGTQICRLSLRTGIVSVIHEDRKGVIRDLCLSHDARRVLFAYSREGRPFKLHEMGVDGTGLRQVTDGPGHDIDPLYLPDGDIIFASTRSPRLVACLSVNIIQLFRCGRDGRNVRPLSNGSFNECTPRMMPNGRAIYHRWEYVDRTNTGYHGLWTMNPDGTGVRLFYHNSNRTGRGVTVFSPRPVPGASEVLAVHHPNHGTTKRRGALAWIDESYGPDTTDAIRFLSSNGDALPAGQKALFSEPWPLDRELALAAYARQIVVVDRYGGCEPLFTLMNGRKNLADVFWQERARREDLQCLYKTWYWPQPLTKGVKGAAKVGADGPEQWTALTPLVVDWPTPLASRPVEPIIPSRVMPEQRTGTLMLQNVNIGRDLVGLAPGSIRSLLLLEIYPVLTVNGFSPHPYWDMKGVIGSVPVEADGSAHFEVPAMRPILIVARDQNGMAVKRMHSFINVQPGEKQSCIGCHEPFASAPGTGGKPLALARPPSAPEAPVFGPLDFARDVQPILDRHCISCHDLKTFAGKVALVGDQSSAGPFSYVNLRSRDLPGMTIYSDGDDKPDLPKMGSGAARATFAAKLDGRHHDVKLTAAQRRIFLDWMDCGGQLHGSYATAGGTGVSTRIFQAAQPVETIATDAKNQSAFSDLLRTSCAVCHVVGEKEGKTKGVLGFMQPLVNHTHPQLSPALLAPLDKAAGGWGLCGRKGGGRAVFASRDDAAYQRLHAAVGAMAVKPARSPFKSYIALMKSAGALPADFDEGGQSVDYFAIDRRYFDLQPGMACVGPNTLPRESPK
jgi:mono/diheme cytochrome c family protein